MLAELRWGWWTWVCLPAWCVADGSVEPGLSAWCVADGSVELGLSAWCVADGRQAPQQTVQGAGSWVCELSLRTSA